MSVADGRVDSTGMYKAKTWEAKFQNSDIQYVSTPLQNVLPLMKICI